MAVFITAIRFINADQNDLNIEYEKFKVANQVNWWF
jgi:hypothetical protein